MKPKPNKRPRNRRQKPTLTQAAMQAAMLLFALIFCVSGYNLLSVLVEYKQGSSTYEDLRDQYMTISTPSTTDGQNEQATEAFQYVVNFEELRQTNADVIGWIVGPDTVIDYPIMQGTNNDYYLNHLFTKKRNSSGSIFADYRHEHPFKCENTLVYGHRMNNGSMFASLSEYRNQEYYDEHPVLYILTDDVSYRVELFSGYVAKTTSNAFKYEFSSVTDYENYLKSISKRSNFKTDVSVTVYDRIVALVTCTYEYDDARYVVHGKLVPIPEN